MIKPLCYVHLIEFYFCFLIITIIWEILFSDLWMILFLPVIDLETQDINYVMFICWSGLLRCRIIQAIFTLGLEIQSLEATSCCYFSRRYYHSLGHYFLKTQPRNQSTVQDLRDNWLTTWSRMTGTVSHYFFQSLSHIYLSGFVLWFTLACDSSSQVDYTVNL